MLPVQINLLITTYREMWKVREVIRITQLEPRFLNLLVRMEITKVADLLLYRKSDYEEPLRLY